jgi:hypothetical protein
MSREIIVDDTHKPVLCPSYAFIWCSHPHGLLCLLPLLSLCVAYNVGTQFDESTHQIMETTVFSSAAQRGNYHAEQHC